jgi:pSer/pThr/pTyr-binding forkhead associated (FHA) protein
MPPRPPPSSRAGAGRSGGGGSGPPGRNRPPRGTPSSEDEDFSAPLSGEEAYPEDGPPNPELYGDASGAQSSRRDETRVASVQDVEAERTREDEDDNPDATRAGPPVQIVVLAGPDRGRKKRFQSVRMVIGRNKDCDFSLEDQSVSRRHLELVYGEGGVVMRDLGSVSGTQVNDQRVDECVLKHGDELSVGKTRLRFVDEAEQIKELRAQAEAREAEEKREREEAAQEQQEARRSQGAARGGEVDPSDPRLNEATNANYKLSDVLREDKNRDKGTSVVARPRPSTRSGPPSRSRSAGLTNVQKAIVGVAGLVVVLLVAGLIFVPKGPPPPPPVDPNVERARLLMQKARESVRADDYANAVRLVEEAEKLLPGVDEEGLARAARKQQEVLDAFQAVRTLIDEKRFDDARARLTAAPEGTAKTDEVRRKLEAELEEKHLAWRIQQVDEVFNTRDPEAIRPMLDTLPAMNRPAYEEKLAALEAELAKESADEKRRNRNAQERAAANAKERRKQFIEEAFLDVERRFNGGEYQRAVLECDRVVDRYKGEKDVKDRSMALKRLIPQFQSSLADAQKKLEANALESAAKPLRRASELYRQIGFRGSLGNTLDEQLASSSVAAGQSALKRGDLASAGSSFREALRLNPGDGRARDGLEALQKKVEELYLQAYIQRDRDPQAAAEKFKIIIETASEGSEVKRKAEMYLGEVQQ